jgi:hypothetical protein
MRPTRTRIDRDGDTIDFLLRAERDSAAARNFLKRAIDLHAQGLKYASGIEPRIRSLRVSSVSTGRRTASSGTGGAPPDDAERRRLYGRGRVAN